MVNTVINGMRVNILLTKIIILILLANQHNKIQKITIVVILVLVTIVIKVVTLVIVITVKGLKSRQRSLSFRSSNGGGFVTEKSETGVLQVLAGFHESGFYKSYKSHKSATTLRRAEQSDLETLQTAKSSTSLQSAPGLVVFLPLLACHPYPRSPELRSDVFCRR